MCPEEYALIVMETDNSTHFVKAITKIICKMCEIEQQFYKSYHVQTGRQEERSNRPLTSHWGELSKEQEKHGKKYSLDLDGLTNST